LSYYRLLKVDSKASAEELKRAYRKQALKFHPDTNRGDRDAAAMFVLIKNAYEALSDSQLRSEVDSFVQTSRSVRVRGEFSERPGWMPEQRPNPYENDLNYILWDLDDIVSSADFPKSFAYPVLDFLTYLDKWVLMPAGFTYSPARDAREGARDPRTYIDFFVNHKASTKCEFRSVQDYFFNVKHRVMGFQSWTEPGLLSEIKGARRISRLDAMREEILFHVMRSQRIGFYYLFEFEQVKNGLKPAVEWFEHQEAT